MHLVVDETSQADEVPVLVAGLAYRGVVGPLGVRPGPQDQPLPAGASWSALASLRWEVHAALPPVLRAHGLVLLDRGYGSPTLLDLLAALGWHGVVRLQGQRGRCASGGLMAPPDLGALWCPAPAPPGPAPGAPRWPPRTPQTPQTPQTPWRWGGPGAPDAAGAVCKQAGWRQGWVVAAWAEGQAEPWLLVTTLPATRARLPEYEYARRWATPALCWAFPDWDAPTWSVQCHQIYRGTPPGQSSVPR